MADDDRLDQLDYYTLLGAKRDASLDEIKAAFRVFARRYHPDRHAGGSEEKIARATRIYRRGSEAFQTLTHENSRIAYDAGLARGELRLTSDARGARQTPPSGEQRIPAANIPAPRTIQSAAARAFFTRAQEAAREGDLKSAWRHLKSAMEQEPGNTLLEEALHKVEGHLRGR